MYLRNKENIIKSLIQLIFFAHIVVDIIRIVLVKLGYRLNILQQKIFPLSITLTFSKFVSLDSSFIASGVEKYRLYLEKI